MRTLIQNTSERSAVMAAIEGAHIEGRKVTRGYNPKRGALLFTGPRMVYDYKWDDHGEFDSQSDGRLEISGAPFCIVTGYVSECHRAPMALFYGSSGILCHEEVMTPEIAEWFKIQRDRATAAPYAKPVSAYPEMVSIK